MIELWGNGASEHGLELTHIRVLPPLEAEILPFRVARANRAGDVHREAFVD